MNMDVNSWHCRLVSHPYLLKSRWYVHAYGIQYVLFAETNWKPFDKVPFRLIKHGSHSYICSFLLTKMIAELSRRKRTHRWINLAFSFFNWVECDRASWNWTATFSTTPLKAISWMNVTRHGVRMVEQLEHHHSQWQSRLSEWFNQKPLAL